jgi:hypothetical protein
MPGDSYYRCRHCRGFYEATLAACKWCDYDAPFLDTAERPRIFPDRETCRALQLAEYEQLPQEAHDDCMGPPPNDLALLCNCLHCGPAGHVFEAIEMRWIVNERMWACPCTTCGGRGFAFDIHSAENKWRCDECGHFYVPANKDYRPENAKCPQCGCEQASGWFDDGYDEEEFDELESELSEGVKPPGDDKGAESFQDEPLPWEEDEESGPERDGAYDLGISWKESDEEEMMMGREGIPDDIDHPFERGERDSDFNDDDIPF